MTWQLRRLLKWSLGLNRDAAWFEVAAGDTQVAVTASLSLSDCLAA